LRACRLYLTHGEGCCLKVCTLHSRSRVSNARGCSFRMTGEILANGNVGFARFVRSPSIRLSWGMSTQHKRSGVFEMKRSIGAGEAVFSAFMRSVQLCRQNDERHQNKAEQAEAKRTFHGYMIPVLVQSGCMISTSAIALFKLYSSRFRLLSVAMQSLLPRRCDQCRRRRRSIQTRKK
jgi:hypothetical protein